MEEGLKIKIGADVSGLEKGVKQAEQTMGRLKPATNQAAFALQNLGRIASDAPFGFIAIQNNLDPLIQSFGQLKSSTGSTGAALKSLFASLAGPAGIALAFSVVSSAVTSLIQKYGSLGNAVDALFGNLSSAEQAQRGLNKAMTEGVGGAKAEAVEIGALLDVAKDNTIATEGRQQAIDKLKKSYPEYLGFLDLENVNTEKVTGAVNKLNSALILRAKIQGAEKFIADQEAKKFELLSKPLEQNLTLLDKFAATLNFGLGKTGAAALGLLNASQNRLGASLGEITDQASIAEKELQNLYKQLANIGGIKTGISIKPGKTAPVEIPYKLVPDKATVSDSEGGDRRILEQFKIANGIQVPIKLSVPQETFDKLKQFGDAAKNALEIDQLKAKAAEFKAILNQGLAQPLGDLIFNFLDQGKVGFKEFADTAIASIKRIVAQIIASKIIQLLGNALTGGGSGAVGGIFSALTGIFGGVAAPNLGGLGQQGFNLAGQVVFVQRGTDLVGVLNSGNGQIRRTG